jgi:hypothetical protein
MCIYLKASDTCLMFSCAAILNIYWPGLTEMDVELYHGPRPEPIELRPLIISEILEP